MRIVFAMVAVVLAGSAQASDMPGVWSLGETKNCEAGAAWVFLADGYYAEVTLPTSEPHALGLWRDEGNAIAYTHTHVPFAGLENPMERKRLTIVTRTTDKVSTKNYRGVPRTFHRCPTAALKAPANAAAH
jgi:hypothetical protein